MEDSLAQNEPPRCSYVGIAPLRYSGIVISSRLTSRTRFRASSRFRKGKTRCTGCLPNASCKRPLRLGERRSLFCTMKSTNYQEFINFKAFKAFIGKYFSYLLEILRVIFINYGSTGLVHGHSENDSRFTPVRMQWKGRSIHETCPTFYPAQSTKRPPRGGFRTLRA